MDNKTKKRTSNDIQISYPKVRWDSPEKKWGRGKLKEVYPSQFVGNSSKAVAGGSFEPEKRVPVHRRLDEIAEFYEIPLNQGLSDGSATILQKYEAWRKQFDDESKSTAQRLSNEWSARLLSLVLAFCQRYFASNRSSHFCLDCGMEKLVEHACPFHLISDLENEEFYPMKVAADRVSINLLFDSSPLSSHNCDDRIGHTIRNFTVFDANGRIRQCKIEVCPAEDVCITLIRHNLWPSTPSKPERAVHMRMMEVLYSLNMVGKVSLYTACQSMQAFAGITSLEPDKLVLYDALERTLSYATYRSFFQAVHYLRNLPNEGLTKVAQARCAACPLVRVPSQPENEPVVLRFSIDGNFGLNRKDKGMLIETSRQSEFFCDQDKVDSYLKSEKEKDKKIEKDENLCSNFSAGDIRVAVSRNSKLKTKGTFGGCCNHMYPMKFLDMKHGERMAYAKLLLREIDAEFPREVLLLTNYDIACNFVRHLKKRGETDLLNSQRFQYFIPEMHANAHVKKCKLEYSPRIIGTCGMADGEVIERLWSIIGRAAKSMKEMTVTNRLAFFDDMLYEFGVHVNSSLDSMLIQTHLKLDKAEFNAKQKLQLYLKGEHILELTEQWRLEMIDKLSAQSLKPKETWEWKYIALLEKHKMLLSGVRMESDPAVILSLENESNQLKAEARALEIKHNNGESWQLDDGLGKSVKEEIQIQIVRPMVQKLFQAVSDMKHWLDLIPNFAKGQKAFFQINRQIENKMKSVKSLIKQYNTQKKPDSLPKEILLGDTLDLTSDFWDEINVLIGDFTPEDPGVYKIIGA